ncbi:MAG: hypothetical protein ACRCW0_03250 [Clostridium sp.]|uniref:hypothetical protein n=1 Tax=Paraclostridium bifermentans TaxID=1490 RepID=UPI00374F8DE5
MLNKKMKQFTIIDIIERKIKFIKCNTIFEKIEWKNNDEGELLAYNEMLDDVKLMNEEDFVTKYLKIVNNLSIQFNNEEILNQDDLEKMSGYNNAIISILKCINPIYEYDLSEEN